MPLEARPGGTAAGSGEGRRLAVPEVDAICDSTPATAHMQYRMSGRFSSETDGLSNARRQPNVLTQYIHPHKPHDALHALCM